MKTDTVYKWAAANLNRIFLIDAAGALLSSFMPGVVLTRFENVFGIPVKVLYFLAAIPLFFIAYDLFCSQRRIDNKTSALLKGIAFMNLAYCAVSLGAAFLHASALTVFGWAYIFSEIIIVTVIALFELKLAKHSAG